LWDELPCGHELRLSAHELCFAHDLTPRVIYPVRSTFIFQLATCHLQLATFNLPLSTCHFQLATFNFQLATCHLPLATYHLQLATCHSPLI
jgi:hypothetical protein